MQVPESYIEPARALLADNFSEAVEAEQGIDTRRCAACGSDQTTFVIKGKWMAYIMMALKIGFWPIKRLIKCSACGASSDFKQ